MIGVQQIEFALMGRRRPSEFFMVDKRTANALNT